jgi:diguanylate cyclase (GGDEF)-like protein
MYAWEDTDAPLSVTSALTLAFGASAVCIALAAFAASWLPPLLYADDSHTPFLTVARAFVILVDVAAIAGLIRRGNRMSVLDLWVCVALAGAIGETLLLSSAFVRFALGTYEGRFLSLVSGIVTFLALSSRYLDDTRSIARQARYDPLTGLPNRAMFCEYFTRALWRAERAGRRVALLFLDLNGFKAVNDSFGHAAGDDLLRAVAQRLEGIVRRGDFVSRLGGDEFTVVVEDLADEPLESLKAKIASALGTPFELHGHTVTVSTSIGISIFPDNGTEVDRLIELADESMYHAKREGKRVFVPAGEAPL